MESRDRLELLEHQLRLSDALTRAIAYGSPSAAEDYRSSINSEVLALREELNLDENDQVRGPKAEVEEDPAEEEDAFETTEEDAINAEPPAPEDGGGQVLVDDEVHDAPVVVEPASE